MRPLYTVAVPAHLGVNSAPNSSGRLCPRSSLQLDILEMLDLSPSRRKDQVELLVGVLGRDIREERSRECRDYS